MLYLPSPPSRAPLGLSTLSIEKKKKTGTMTVISLEKKRRGPLLEKQILSSHVFFVIEYNLAGDAASNPARAFYNIGRCRCRELSSDAISKYSCPSMPLAISICDPHADCSNSNWNRNLRNQSTSSSAASQEQFMDEYMWWPVVLQWHAHVSRLPR